MSDIEQAIKPSRKGWVILLKDMEPESNDSFTVELHERTNVQATARHAGMKVTVRKDGDKLRVWRLK